MVINADKFLNKSSGRLAMQKAQQEKMVGGGPSNIVLSKKSIKGIEGIKINVIKIEDIFKGSLALDKKQLDDKKKATSKKRKEDIETKLETKPNVESGGKVKLPAAPRMGILDFIKNFIGNVLLGYFAVRLIKHLPKIMPILKFLGGAADFIINTGGFLLNGLATFLDIGYKAYDATRGFLKSFGGENFVKVFDAFNGAVGSVIEAAIIASIALASQGKDGVLDIGMDLLKDRLLGQGAQAATQAATSSGTSAAAGGGASTVGGTATQAGGLSAGAVAAVVAGAGLLSSALGEGAFQVRKFAVKPIQKLENDQKNDKNPFTRFGRGVALNMIRPLFGLFQTVGVLLDIVGAPFRYAIELLRYPFLSEEDKVKQAGNLAKFDARIREDFRKALNMVTLGFAFKEKGSFGNIYGNQGAQKEMMSKMAGGGITRGGKSAGGVKRTISKGKYKRVLTPQKPSKTEFKDKEVKKSTEDLDKTKYFGPILAVSSKIMNNEEPTDRDYQNVGLGINLLIAKGIQDKQLKGGIVAKFAGGGLVDPDVLSAAETGGDISNWVAKAFRGAIETGAQKTMRLMKEMREKKAILDAKEGKGKDAPSLEVGPGGVVTGGNADFWALAAIASLESGHPQGRADVAQVLYNRLASGVYTGKTLKELIVAKNQFQPTREGNPILWAAISDKQSAIAALNSHPRGKNGAQMIEESASAIQNPALQKSAAEFVGGRTDFAQPGAAQKYPGGLGFIERHGHLFGWYVGPGAIAYGKKNPGPARAPMLGDIVVMGGGPGAGGSLGGSGQFIQGNSGSSAGVHFHIGPGSQVGGTILQRQYFGDARATAKQAIDYFLSKGSRIYDGRRGTYYKSGNEVSAAQQAHTAGGSAGGIDMQVDFEKPHPFPLKTAGMAYRPNGFGVSADIVGSNSFVAHGRYDQSGKVAPQERMKLYAKGGRVLKPTFAMLGEKGPEFVFDADTTAGLDRLAPQLLEKLNIAKTKPQLASILQSYASYDARSEASQTFIVQSSPPPPPSDDYGSDGGGGMLIASGGDSFSTLYQGS
jgi:hypothetical protein